MGSRSSATARRASLRRGAKLRRRGAVITIFTAFADAVLSSGTVFGNYARELVDGRHIAGGSSSKDLLPMPPVTQLESLELRLGVGEYASALIMLANLGIAGLNFLSVGGRGVAVPERANLAQRSSQRRQCAKWLGLIRRGGDSNEFLKGASNMWRRSS